MPGQMEHVEGLVWEVRKDHSTVDSCWSPVYDVKDKRVSITVEEVES